MTLTMMSWMISSHPMEDVSARANRALPVVCHMSTVHYTFDTRIFHKECVSLAGAGYEVYWVVPHERREMLKGVLLVPLRRFTGRMSRMLLGPISALKAAMSTGADLFHIHDPELLPAALVLRLLGRRVIYDVHEDFPEAILSRTWIPGPLRRLVSWVFSVLESFASRRMSAIVCATMPILERFSSIGLDAVCVRNYPIENELSAGAVASPVGSVPRHVCYVGSIGASRGIFEMIEAVERAGVGLLLAGEFHSAAEKQKAVSMPGWRNVEELGQLDREGIAATLARSFAGLVLLRPTKAYIQSLPIKMFEYMSVGLPVIASDFPGWREIVEGNGCGICVDPSDGGSVAAAIRRIADTPEDAERMGENGTRAVRELYSWNIEAKTLLELYDRIFSR